MTTWLYRILSETRWRAAQAAGEVAPSPLDQRDGFIHLSAYEQVLATADLYFRPAVQPLVLELDPSQLPGPVNWSPVPDRNALFPHLDAANIPLAAVRAVLALEVRPHGFAWGLREPFRCPVPNGER